MLSIEGYTMYRKTGVTLKMVKQAVFYYILGMKLFLMISTILIKVSPNQSGVELR